MTSAPPSRMLAGRMLAVVATAVTLAALGAAIAYDVVAPGETTGNLGPATPTAVVGLCMALPGALLLWRLGPHPIAFVLAVAGALWAVDGPAGGVVNLALVTGTTPPEAVAGFWYWVRFGAVLLLPIQLILLLFPDGRLPAGRWRIVAYASLALGLVMPVVYLLAPAAAFEAVDPTRAVLLDRFDPQLPTLPLPLPVWTTLLSITFPATALSTAVALAVTIGRRRGADAVRRAQLRWLIWAGLVFVGLLLLTRFIPTALGDILFPVGVIALTGAIVVAVTRHGLYTIDRLLSWTIVSALLIASVVLVDVSIYLALGAIIDDRVTLLAAVLVVLVVYTPLRDRLLRLVGRWVHGARDDPYEVVSSLADRLESAPDSGGQLAELARSIARAFASGYVAVELDRPDGRVISAETGTPAEDTVLLPLHYQGRDIGRIRMQPGRRPAISRRDRRLLSDLVRFAAATIRAGEVNRELQTIREGLVAAREEERSRLRRELHDGLGPLLGGIRLRLETARNLAGRDPALSLATLDVAIAESRAVVDEIRTLVHDLRPPALDDLGLVRAVAQQAERLTGAGLTITVDADDLPPLSAAVEVAAYRIASEALTNVVKHAQARAAAVRLRAPIGCLVVEVQDDGTGVDPGRTAGVGLASIRLRAGELGGTVDLLPADPGTVVRATLPRGAEASDAAA